ncbi:HEAT repeat domain-containing protein [Actinocorallia aurea]
MDEVFARLREKMGTAGAKPGSGELFGARTHGFRMNAPLPEADVMGFERAHDVRLPKAYREFVTRFGDGGAGPDYGVLPLAEAAAAIVDDPGAALSMDSPFEDAVYGPEWWDGFFDSEEDHDAEHCRGALAVVHGGCTTYTLLVVTGPLRGRLVRVDLNGVPAPVVLPDADFLAWYERWLDDVIEGRDLTFFHDRLLGGEAEFRAAARDADPDVRLRAVRSFNALPGLSAAARTAVVAAVADPSWPVRSAAVWTAGRLRIAEAADAVRVALADPAKTVRLHAVDALRALEAPGLVELARAALADPSPEVRSRAVFALQDRNALTLADLAPLAASPDARTRRLAAYGLREAAGDPTALVRTALADPVPDVRWTAVQAAGHRRLTVLLPVLARMLAEETYPTVLVNLRRVVPAFREDASAD